MKNDAGLLFLAGLSLISLTCSKSTEPAAPGIVAFQAPGCQQVVGGLSSPDSCFSYRYEDLLLVDFCATGNCCPDSNRFLIQCEIRQDTILVTIADTAANLCRCNCRYLLHVQLTELSLPSYQFVCVRKDESAGSVLYSERVYRKPVSSTRSLSDDSTRVQLVS